MSEVGARPHIVIITDQQRFDTIRALGFPYMDTPAWTVVNEGVTFTERHHITAAVVRVPRPASSPATITPPASSKRRPVAPLLGRVLGRGRVHLHQHRQDAHLSVPHAAGLPERYVVENKDHILEGATTSTKWDKALHAAWAGQAAA
ncbi:MAG: hypothetical protein R2838_14015 [Caldilineaceae bacterium]